MRKALYEVKTRKVGYTTFLSVVCERGQFKADSSQKVIPYVIQYDKDANFEIIGPKTILSSMNFHPYKANSKDFNAERLADYHVSQLYSQLDHFPTLPSQIVDGQSMVHPVAELIYSQMIYLKPTAGLQEELDKLSFVKQSKLLSEILEKVLLGFEKKTGTKIDLFSVPKNDVGSFGFIADKDGFANLAKIFNFGFHKAFPSDRLLREVSSLKAAERFSNPSPLPFDFPEAIRPYVTMLRVGIIGTKHSMLDGGDLMRSGEEKIACKLTRRNVIKDVSSIPVGERKLAFKPFKSGIEVVHEEIETVDEEVTRPGGVRLVIPGGVKVAAQPTDQQAFCENSRPIDLILDFQTFAKKGALACFAMSDSQNYSKEMTLEECKEHFHSLKRETITIEGERYEGYVIELPVMRPGQRYTELSKASNNISTDLIGKAILNKPVLAKKRDEEEYKSLVSIRAGLIRYLSSMTSENN